MMWCETLVCSRLEAACFGGEAGKRRAESGEQIEDSGDFEK